MPSTIEINPVISTFLEVTGSQNKMFRNSEKPKQGRNFAKGLKVERLVR